MGGPWPVSSFAARGCAGGGEESPRSLPGSAWSPAPSSGPKCLGAAEGFLQVVAPKMGAGSCPLPAYLKSDPFTLFVPPNLGFWHSPWRQIWVSSVTWAPLPGHRPRARSLRPCSALCLQPPPLPLAVAARLKTKLGWGRGGAASPGDIQSQLDAAGAER